MSKHYPNGVTLDEMAELKEGDTIQCETCGFMTVVEPHYGALRRGSLPPDKPGPVIQRCVRARMANGEIHLYMVGEEEEE